MTDLVALLQDVVAEVEPGPSLLEDVTRGGRRRKARRRVAAVTASLVALAGVGAWTVSALPAGHGPVRLAGPLFHGATHGDLAGDRAYVSQVLQAWDASHRTSANAGRGIFDDLQGPARVVWAGRTPAGPAALVAQDAYLHHHADLQLTHEGTYQLLGFVGVDASGALRVVGDTYPDPDDLEATAWWVDPGRTVLAVVDDGVEHGVSASWTYAADGRATRTYEPIADHDGVGWASVEGTVGTQVAKLPYTGFTDAVEIQGAPELSTTQPPALDWTGHRVLGAGTASTSVSVELFKALSDRRTGSAYIVGAGRWWVAATTPDGRRLGVGMIRLDNDPTRLFAELTATDGSTTVIDEGVLDGTKALPVAIHLPDGQGWLVARFGARLEWRAGQGPWTSVGDAALLPEAATQVRESTIGPPTVVDLRAG